MSSHADISMFKLNREAHFYHKELVYLHVSRMWSIDSVLFLHNMQMFGLTHSLTCNFSHVSIAFLETIHMNTLTFVGYFVLHITFVFFNLTPPSMNWRYVDIFENTPFFSHFLSGLLFISFVGCTFLRIFTIWPTSLIPRLPSRPHLL